MQLFSLLLTFVLSFLVHVFAKVTKLPEGFPRCFRDDPELNECLVQAANDAKPFLISGVPELNLPSILPFIIPEVKIQNGNDALNFKAAFTNMTFYGLQTYNFTKFQFDPDKLKFHCEVTFGKLHIEAEYQITGKILVAPISGSGRVYINITNADGSLDQDSRLVKRKGDTYIEPTDNRVKLKFGKAECQFDGLFDGNKQLAEAANRVINENSDELMNEITPAIEEVMQQVFNDMLTRSTARLPYDIVYPVKQSR